MNTLTVETLKAYCLAKPQVTEEYPFDVDPVYKVLGKIFAFVSGESGCPILWVKCDPALVPLLRATYASVTSAPYMSKTHWNQVTVDGSIPEDEVLEMIDQSYRLVVKGLPKKLRDLIPQ